MPPRKPRATDEPARPATGRPVLPKLADVRPMLAPERSYPPFTDPDWLLEIKWDGYRMLASIDHGAAELRTKGGAFCSSWFPEVASQLALLPGGPHILDGEAVHLDELGRSDFVRFLERARKRRYVPGTQVTYMVFDLLVHDGELITGQPLLERKARLAKLLAGVPKKTVIYVDHFPAEAALFDQVVVPLALEGFMAKRSAGPYVQGPDRCEDWRKMKRKGAIKPGFRRA
jgi:bifunctional non-homologous end joining protein LigD